MTYFRKSCQAVSRDTGRTCVLPAHPESAVHACGVERWCGTGEPNSTTERTRKLDEYATARRPVGAFGVLW